MKQQNLFSILLAFLIGQAIQLVTVALGRYLYVSDIVVVCIAVAIMTSAVVVLSSVFTTMENGVAGSHARKTFGPNPLRPVSYAKRPALDTDPEDIDEIDKNTVKDLFKGEKRSVGI